MTEYVKATPHIRELWTDDWTSESEKSKTLKLYIAKFVPYKMSRSVISVPVIQTKNFESGKGYLFSSKDIDESKLDETDKDFTKNFSDSSKFTKKEVHGLHTCVGYRMFFRPEIEEVANMALGIINKEDLEKINRIYVTTNLISPDDTANYDTKLNAHKAKTTYYILYK